MSIQYNVTGSRRKALVMAIGEFLGMTPVYKGTPTFAYEIGNLTVDRNGALSFLPHVNAYDNDLEPLVAVLKKRGFEGESDEPPYKEGDDALEWETGDDRLVVEFPKEGFSDDALENLRKIIASKDRLIKKALGIAGLPFHENGLTFGITEDRLRFPWFTLTGEDGEMDAYTRFVCALCGMARKQKRVTAKERDVGNDKFTMRLFLIRLGFVGKEHAKARHILLRNLTGNTAWKNGRPPAAAENTSDNAEERDAVHYEQQRIPK